MAAETEKVVSVDPALLIGDLNSRFGLKRSRIETMKASILEQGRILVPLEVTKLASPVDGAQYRIEDGHYRHAAAVELTKDHEGVVVPIIVRKSDGNAIDRLKRQTAFNFEREALTPMDVALAAKTMLDNGVPRQEIRDVFKNGGGRKGGKVQPASNSYINMMISFLDFPKDIQKKIHEGVIGVAAAYKLTLKPQEKWAEIVTMCEQEREEELKAEESREEKYLGEIKKSEERDAKRKQTEIEAEAAKSDVEAKAKLLDDLIKAETEATATLRKGAPDAETKKKLEEAANSAKAFSVAAVKSLDEAKKERDKLTKKLDSIQQQAEARKNKLAEARQAAAGKKEPDAKVAKPIGASQVDKAAAKAGVGTLVKLTATQMRDAVREWALPGSFPKVQEIAQIIMKCFDSELTYTQAYSEMAKATGEKETKAKAAKK